MEGIEVAVQGLLKQKREIDTPSDDDVNRRPMAHPTSLHSLGGHFSKWVNLTTRNNTARDKTHRFILVLELGDRVLSSALLHDNICGENMPVVRTIMKDLALALNHMHEEERIHGDMKPLNAVDRKGQWVPIDLDVACTIGKPFGTKIPSSGYCPPEMAAVMLRATDDKGSEDTYIVAKLAEYIADVAYDLWSLGSILFNLVIGTPLWETFYGDGISHGDHVKLVLWSKSHLLHRLHETGVASRQEGEMGAAFDLICKLLEPVCYPSSLGCAQTYVLPYSSLGCSEALWWLGSTQAIDTGYILLYKLLAGPESSKEPLRDSSKRS